MLFKKVKKEEGGKPKKKKKKKNKTVERQIHNPNAFHTHMMSSKVKAF
jgi:hypothetical protein